MSCFTRELARALEVTTSCNTDILTYIFLPLLQDHFTKHLLTHFCYRIISSSIYLFVCVARLFHQPRTYLYLYCRINDKNLIIPLSVAGSFHTASHFCMVHTPLEGKIVACVGSDCVNVFKHFQDSTNCQNFRNWPSNKSALFSWPLRGIYRSLCLVQLKFDSFEIKVTSMEGVKTEQHLEGKSELEVHQEGERTVKSDTFHCASVGTQCEQNKDNDSIIVMKCSYSDSEDTVLRYREDSQGVSIIAFNTLCTDSELVLWVH